MSRPRGALGTCNGDSGWLVIDLHRKRPPSTGNTIAHSTVEKQWIEFRQCIAFGVRVGENWVGRTAVPEGSDRWDRQMETRIVIHCSRAMRNVTISLPEDLALWLRVRAAEHDRSVSSWLAEVIEAMKRQEDNYHSAMERALAIKPRDAEWTGGRRPTRDELHDRHSSR